MASKPTTPELIVPTQTFNSPLGDIFDFLDHLLKTVILFVAEYGSTP